MHGMLTDARVRRIFAAVAFGLAFCCTKMARSESDAPLHYYDAAIGKTGLELKAALQAIIKGQTVIPYTSTATDTWDALKVLDQDPENPNNVILIYSGASVSAADQSSGNGGSWNREHCFPQSYGLIALGANSRAKTDLFNLHPVNPNVNSTRNNKYYDVTTPPALQRVEAPTSTYDSDSWEPRDADKGFISRACFYMATRYDGSDRDAPDLELSDNPDPTHYVFGKLSVFLAWSRYFPVDAAERRRNTILYQTYQHNRNPFIDHPEYAEMVFKGITHEQAWKNVNFSDEELSDANLGADAADPDHDGIPNLIEYALNGDPWTAEPAPKMVVNLTSAANSSNYVFAFVHNRNATDASIFFEQTNDFSNWTIVNPQSVASEVRSSEAEEVTVTLPPLPSGYFVRARVTSSSGQMNRPR